MFVLALIGVFHSVVLHIYVGPHVERYSTLSRSLYSVFEFVFAAEIKGSEEFWEIADTVREFAPCLMLSRPGDHSTNPVFPCNLAHTQSVVGMLRPQGFFT